MREQRIELAPHSPSLVAADLLHAHLVLAAPGVRYAKVERTSPGKVRRPWKSKPGSEGSVLEMESSSTPAKMARPLSHLQLMSTTTDIQTHVRSSRQPGVQSHLHTSSVISTSVISTRHHTQASQKVACKSMLNQMLTFATQDGRTHCSCQVVKHVGSKHTTSTCINMCTYTPAPRLIGII
jgi:hypothetical protein